MIYWPRIGIYKWHVAVQDGSDLRLSVDREEWVREADDTVDDYREMGLVLYQGWQLLEGLEETERLVRDRLPQLVGESRPDASSIDILDAIANKIPNALIVEEEEGLDAADFLDGLRWAVERTEQLRHSILHAGYSWQPFRGQEEHTITVLSDERQGKGREPTWRFANHCCDLEVGISHLRQDLELMQLLMKTLGHVYRGIVDQVTIAVTDTTSDR